MNIECKKPNYCVENSKTYKLCDYKKKWKKKYRPNAPKCYFFNFFILGISLFCSFSEQYYAHHNWPYFFKKPVQVTNIYCIADIRYFLPNMKFAQMIKLLEVECQVFLAPGFIFSPTDCELKISSVCLKIQQYFFERSRPQSNF